MATIFSKPKPILKKLPADFVPSQHSVVIGKAKECKQCPGNTRLRSLAKAYLTHYAGAINRSIKSQIVSHIAAMVNEACGPKGGAFIKIVGNAKDGSPIWAEASESAAREKIGYVFRDLLSNQYRSSSKSKSMKRLVKARKQAGLLKKPQKEPAADPTQTPVVKLEPTPDQLQGTNVVTPPAIKSYCDLVGSPPTFPLIPMANQHSEDMNAKADVLHDIPKRPVCTCCCTCGANAGALAQPMPLFSTAFFSPEVHQESNAVHPEGDADDQEGKGVSKEVDAVRQEVDLIWLEAMAQGLQEV